MQNFLQNLLIIVYGKISSDFWDSRITPVLPSCGIHSYMRISDDFCDQKEKTIKRKRRDENNVLEL